MSDKNQEQEISGSVMDNHIDKSKRKFSKAGMVAPVIMTLASKPVFAVQGLSNMISTHGSAACRGDDRYGGMGVNFWKKAGGEGMTVLNDIQTQAHPDVSVIGAWEIAGFVYGTYDGSGNKNFASNYTGGTVDPGFGTSKTLRKILKDGGNNSHLVAGLLNASYFEAKAGGGTTQYIFTVAEFWDMYNNPGNYFVGDFPYTDLVQLIASNYGGTPNNCVLIP